MVLSVGCECIVSLVHKAWFDDEFFLQPLRIYKTVLKKCHLYSGTNHPHVACLLCLWPILLRNSIARVICPSMYEQGFFFSTKLIYPYFWVCLYAIWHIILVDKCQCGRVQLYDVRHNEIQSSTTAFNLQGKRSLKNFVVFNNPNFFLRNE